jgi:hypothetical protein
MELANQRQIEVKRAAAVAVLFVGAAAARIFWVSQNHALYGAEPFYSWLGSASLFSPLYAGVAGFLARVLDLFGMSQAQSLGYGSMMVYAIAGGLLVAPAYGIARRMGGEGIAAGVGLATVFYPASLAVLPGAAAMTEPLYLLLVASAWYFLLRSVDEGSLWLTALGGLLIGFAYLARTSALPFMAIALGLLLFATWQLRRENLEVSRAATNVVLALVAFGAVVGIYLAAINGIRI